MSSSSQKLKTVEQPFEIGVLKDFALEDLDLFFTIASFEREIRPSHVAEIAKAIMEGRLYDNVITVMKKKDKKDPYIIVDGQHRFEALKMLFENEDLDTYTITLRILQSEDDRNAYRSINLGKPLTLDDILKSYDDDSILLFNRLREYCAFYMTSATKVPYSLVVKALIFAKGTSVSGGSNRERVIKTALGASGDDVAMLYGLVSAVYGALHGTIDMRSPLFKVAVFYNLCRAHYRNFENAQLPVYITRFQNVLRAVAADREIKELAKQGRNIIILEAVEKRIKEIWAVV